MNGSSARRNQCARAALIEMTVPGRSSTTDKLLRGALRTRRRPSGMSAPSAAEAVPEVRVTRVARPRARGRRPTESGGEFDRTTYTCQCGFVFQAAVVTSVACPHCGDSQAW